MAKRGRKAKDPFAEISSEWKDAVMQSNEEEVRKRISEVALNDEALSKAKESDSDLKMKQAEAKVANAVYRDGFKANRLKIKFAKQVLEGQGKPAGESGLAPEGEV